MDENRSTLELIGHLCPETHGNGVYMAKSLYHILDADKVIESQCLTPEFLSQKVDKISSKEEWMIYPNPATDYVLMNNKSCDFKSLQVFDAMGKLVKEYGNVKNHSISIDLKLLMPGFYILKAISVNESTFQSKIVKN
jgi:hypothetical protein